MTNIAVPVRRAGAAPARRAGAVRQTGTRPAAPATTGRLPALDGLRAVAAGSVLVFHIAMETGTALQNNVTAAVLSRAEVGVPLFFALSGLLLYRPWAVAALHRRSGPPVRPYLVRRALRIFPAYWIVLACALLLWSRAHVGDPRTWVELGLLVQNYDPTPWWNGSGPPGLVQMWSLSVEVAFYLTLPLIAAVLGGLATGGRDVATRARRLLYGVAALGACAYPWTVLEFYPSYRGYLHMYLPRCLTYFAVGIALAIVSGWARLEPDGASGRFARRVVRAWAWWWAGAALCYLVAATPLTGPRLVPFSGVGTALAEQLLYTAVVAGVLTPVALLPARSTRPGRLLGNRVMSYLGRISYGLFLWQFVVIFLWYDGTGQRPWTGGFWVNLLAVAAITCVLAMLSYHAVEQPVRRLYRRHTRWRTHA